MAGDLLVKPSESAGAILFVGLVVFVVEIYELVVDVLIEIVVIVFVFVVVEVVLVVEVDVLIIVLVVKIIVEGFVLEVVISAPR